MSRRSLIETSRGVMAGLSDAWAHSTDGELAARTREGDPDALAALYERFARALMRLAYHIVGSAADAQDVLHEVAFATHDRA